MISGALKTTFTVPQNRVAELIATTLPACGWKVIHFNEELKTCTADRKVDMGAGDPNSIYNYTANLEWNQAGADKAYQIRIEINEQNSKATKDECKTLCAEFFRRCTANNERLAANPLKEKTTYGGAKWASMEDLRKANYIVPNGDFDPKSLLVAPAEEGSIILIPPKEAVMHSVVCGSTGTGKTSGFIIPQAVTRLNASAIFTEATDGTEPPAVYSKTATWRHEKGGQDIYYFNPDDLSSNQINLITTIKTAEDADTIARLIMRNTSQSANTTGDNFWEQAETYLMNALLIHAAGVNGTIASVRALVQRGPTALDNVVKQSPFQKARDEYQGFLNTGTENTRSNVFIGLLQRFNPWTLPTVQKVTERTDIDLLGLRDRLFSFYLAVPAEKTNIQPVSSLVLSYLLDVVLQADVETGLPMKHPLMLILDEFTNFGQISNFAKKLSIIRHRDVGVTIGFQFVKQIVEVYGKNTADTIMSQLGTRIFLRPRDLETADGISRQLGQRTHYERKVNTNGAIVEKEVGVPLLPAGDILAMKNGEAILFTPSTDPIKIKPYQWKDFEHATSLPPWKRRRLEVNLALERAIPTPGPVESTEFERDRPKDRDEHKHLKDERLPEL